MSYNFESLSLRFQSRCKKTIAEMEHNGIPINSETLQRLKANWIQIKGCITLFFWLRQELKTWHSTQKIHFASSISEEVQL